MTVMPRVTKGAVLTIAIVLAAWGAAGGRAWAQVRGRAQGGVCIQDDLHRRVCLARPARRIIALYGAFNEILAGMGLEERLVARTKADRSPPSILRLPSIGTHMRPNVEMVFALHPDLVIQGGGRRAALEPVRQLVAHSIPVAFFNPTDFPGLFSTILRIGTLTGARERAREMVEGLRARLERVRREVAGKGRPTVVFEVRYPNLLCAGGRSMVDAIIEAAGGRNCFHGVAKKFVRPSMETVLQCRPWLYVVQEGPMNRHPTPLKERPIFSTMEAVRSGRVLYVEERRYSRPTQDAVAAVEELARRLHPEVR